MICKTCICHTEMKPEKVYGNSVWCKRYKVSRLAKLSCVHIRSICGSCTKCDEETGER